MSTLSVSSSWTTQGMSPLSLEKFSSCDIANGNVVVIEIGLKSGDGDFIEMENAGRQGRVSFSQGKYFEKIFFSSGTAGCNDRNGEQIVQLLQGIDGKSIFRPVVVHAGEQDLTGASLLTFFGPGE